VPPRAAERPRGRRSVAAELRLARLLPVSAFANGAFLALAPLALYALARFAWGPAVWLPDGAGGGRLAPDAHDFAVAMLAIGFAIGGVRYTFEANGRDLVALAKRGALARHVPETPLLRKASLARARLAGCAGAVAGLVPAALLQPYTTGPGVWPAGWVCAQLAYLTVCSLLGRAIWFSVETARFFEQITPEPSAIDLLDPAPLYAFGRMGLRLSFTWVVGLTLFSLLTLFGTRASATAAAPVLVAIAATAGMALVVPVRTLRRRIRDRKAAERAWLDGEIRRLRDQAARLAGARVICARAGHHEGADVAPRGRGIRIARRNAPTTGSSSSQAEASSQPGSSALGAPA
jgi:hypothetical protein